MTAPLRCHLHVRVLCALTVLSAAAAAAATPPDAAATRPAVAPRPFRCAELDRAGVVARMDASRVERAPQLLHESVRFERVPAAFLRGGAVYRFVQALPAGFEARHFACLDATGGVTELHGDLAAYVRAAPPGALDLSTDALREAYVATDTALQDETTVIARVEDAAIRLRHVSAHLRAVVQRELGRPRTHPSGPPWRVTLLALRRDQLVRVEAEVLPDGTLQRREVVLARRLPLLQWQ